MNILHMKYAVEVARAGSLNKASENLYVALPNISRSIKELEADLGITIFERSTKGVTLTAKGEEFIDYAKDILKQISIVEDLYKNSSPEKQKFSLSAPQACYISEAFAEFSKSIGRSPAEIFYRETNYQDTINNVVNHDYKLGIIRYSENYDRVFKSLLDEKSLNYEMVAEFSYKLIMSKESPLAKKDNISFDDLVDYIEISHSEPYVPSMPLLKVVKEDLSDNIERRIFIYDRASQLALLSKNIETFMWVSSASSEVLEKYNLVLKDCVDNNKIYKDVLIYKKDYKLSKLDNRFITSLCEAKRKQM